ncbi:hypothetical protein [Microbacterium sp. 1P06AB]|uniref:hypothetical protein n=1 Tax=Microbacterium sp. 1P06AB TaxID=3132289 RepID=UPI0039A7336D
MTHPDRRRKGRMIRKQRRLTRVLRAKWESLTLAASRSGRSLELFAQAFTKESK